MTALLQMPFDRARRIKYELGRQEHRQATTDEFQGDVLIEIYNECLDLQNYIEEAQKRGHKVPSFAAPFARSLALWVQEHAR